MKNQSSDMKSFKLKSHVQWKWLGRPIHGKVEEVFTTPVVQVIKGKRIKRNGSPAVPAYLVRSNTGNLALKLHSKLQAYQPRKSAWRDVEE